MEDLLAQVQRRRKEEEANYFAGEPKISDLEYDALCFLDTFLSHPEQIGAYAKAIMSLYLLASEISVLRESGDSEYRYERLHRELCKFDELLIAPDRE